MSSNKRVAMGSFMGDILQKKAKLDESSGAAAAAPPATMSRNPFLQHPVIPDKALHAFLMQVQAAARQYLPTEQQKQTITSRTLFCEVEARLGILSLPHAVPARRVCAGGAKTVPGGGGMAMAFDGTPRSSANAKFGIMATGLSRLHFTKWTAGGLSEVGPLTLALGLPQDATSRHIKEQMVEHEYVETVYGGYEQDRRVVYRGDNFGKMESKQKLCTLDLVVPAAPYDVRVTLSTEQVTDRQLPAGGPPPPGWKNKRVKRRRSYWRRDNSMAWQIDVTEVTTTTTNTATGVASAAPEVDYELELELRESAMLELLNEHEGQKRRDHAQTLASQLWWMLQRLNPLHDALNVEECLQQHPNAAACQQARTICHALRKYVGSGGTYHPQETLPASVLQRVSFPGCMPVNFSRHNLDEIQRSGHNAYYVSEKTDGVRHFMIFCQGTVVLVDRAMECKQPIVPSENGKSEPCATILPLIEQGTVFDGEVVMNRRTNAKPRPIFIVFDVIALSMTKPVLHEPFDRRLKYLNQAAFRTPSANRDMFDAKFVADMTIALPLVRKNFCERTDLDELLSHVVEERGMRCYRNGDLHNHLTDGIIFQPNRPYVCGTDHALLKWKYLDTVTIDLEIIPARDMDEDDEVLRVACLGEEQTRIDMTRYVRLPSSDRMRLEADRTESGGRIAEVGFDPETGEWYYLTMRSDKVVPNHISTVMGTLLELSESLTTDELRYRMSIPAGQRDTYGKDMRGMLKQLLDHQRRQLKESAKAKKNSF